MYYQIVKNSRLLLILFNDGVSADTSPCDIRPVAEGLLNKLNSSLPFRRFCSEVDISTNFLIPVHRHCKARVCALPAIQPPHWRYVSTVSIPTISTLFIRLFYNDTSTVDVT